MIIDIDKNYSNQTFFFIVIKSDTVEVGATNESTSKQVSGISSFTATPKQSARFD